MDLKVGSGNSFQTLGHDDIMVVADGKVLSRNGGRKFIFPGL